MKMKVRCNSQTGHYTEGNSTICDCGAKNTTTPLIYAITALNQIITTASMNYESETCRLIIETAQEALSDIKKMTK